jgi:hypothetical protein
MEKQELYFVQFRFSGDLDDASNHVIAWREANGYNVVVGMASDGTGMCGLESLSDAERMALENGLVITKVELIEDELQPA